MRRKGAAASLLLVLAICAWSLPKVDGKVSEGEYSRSISLVYGSATLYYQPDPSGGLYLAFSAPTTGWVGVGLGSVVMDGAHIFMGFLKDGKQVISEQIGQGNGHQPSPIAWADQSAVGQQSGMTTLELHIPADRVAGMGQRIGFITAFAGTPDLTTFHEDNHDGGFIDLPPE